MKSSLYPISYVLMIIIFFMHLLKNKRSNNFGEIIYRHKTILIAFSLVLLSMTISNILSPISGFMSWRVEFNYIFRYMFIFLILLFLYEENFFTLRFLLIAIFSSLMLQGIDGIFQAIYNYDFIKGHEATLSSGLTGATFNRNVFGMFMAIGSSLSFGLLFDRNVIKLKQTDIYFLSISFTVFIFNLMFSYSRASWLFLSTFIFILYAVNYKRINRKHILFLFVFIIIGVISFKYNQNLLNRFDSLVEGNSSHRYDIWIHALSLIKEKILFGYGLVTYHIIGLKNFGGTHNSIIEILLFLGIFGFITYANLLWKVFNKIMTNKSTIQLALFFAFLVILQFDSSIMKGITTLSPLTIFSFFIFKKNI